MVRKLRWISPGGWLGEHGISLPLGERYMGHIKLGIDENTGLFYERV